jgi:DNA-binding PadR family transcriptional regulator
VDSQTREILRAVAAGDVQSLIAQHGLPAVRQYVDRFKAEGLIAGKLRESRAGNVRSMIRLTPKGQALLDA